MSTEKRTRLYQGLPDGHLESGGVGTIYNMAHFKYPATSGISTLMSVDGLTIRSDIFRPHDIPENMENGMDIGVTGRDFLIDHYLKRCRTYGQDPLEDSDLKYEFVELLDFECRPSRLLFLVRKNGFKPPVGWEDIRAKFTEGNKMKTASEYPSLMEYCLSGIGIPHQEVRYFRGKEESFLSSSYRNGYDCVIAVGETGKSIKDSQNALVIDGSILLSTPRLVVKRKIYELYAEALDKYVEQLASAKEEYRTKSPDSFKDRFDETVCPKQDYLQISDDASLNELLKGVYRKSASGPGNSLLRVVPIQHIAS